MAISTCKPMMTYFNGKLLPYEYPTAKVAESMQKLRKLYPWLDEVNKKYIK
jgi:membrane protein insertase Oxa1/YidC/SpoIIIJ